jgi:CRP-like cAMP-binding protein
MTNAGGQSTHGDREGLAFSAWGDGDWSKLLLYTQSRRYTAGELLLQAGEADRTLYIVVGGVLEVLLPGSPPQVVATVPQGSLLGEQAFTDGRPRSAHVRARTDGEIVGLSPEYFEAFALGYPELALTFLLDLARILSLKLRATTAQVSGAPVDAAADLMPPRHRVDVDTVTRAQAAASRADAELLDRMDRHLNELRRRPRPPA